MSRCKSKVVRFSGHNWIANSGRGGEPRFKGGLSREPVMHVKCSECGERTWMTEAQWKAVISVQEKGT